MSVTITSLRFDQWSEKNILTLSQSQYSWISVRWICDKQSFLLINTKFSIKLLLSPKRWDVCPTGSDKNLYCVLRTWENLHFRWCVKWERGATWYTNIKSKFCRSRQFGYNLGYYDTSHGDFFPNTQAFCHGISTSNVQIEWKIHHLLHDHPVHLNQLLF